ncbi:hypothetical protein H6G76_16155 [Nostoc sp. FACHB-152]|uniref:hypothetical protein n=1 Tax=unclassified Nostoc TaxID=2593658 RepID=UPI001684C72D|nr:MULTISPECIES: hypothetical protein [unclassified Nostoc]MBD2448656.1 hypothetical protein [Nostoc sp. FACHB-152]MBD2468359.1 hypothetical protein [Nostoc sp. FACHB-145]
MRSLKPLLSLSLIAGFCLPGYGLSHDINTSRVEAQLMAQNSYQYLNAPVKVTLNTEFDLKYGQIAYLRTGGIEIKFSKVLQDSRCPSNVTCIWQGQVIIELEILQYGRKVSTLNLTLIPGRDASAVQFFNKYTVKLIDVSPYPKDGQQIFPQNYIARIVVTKERP